MTFDELGWVTPGSETRNLKQGLLRLELTSLFPRPYSVFGRVTRANTDGGGDDGDQQDRRRMQSTSHHFVPASSGSTVMIRCQGAAGVGREES